MDNYLSLKGRGLSKRKRFISHAWELDIARFPDLAEPLFPLEINYLII